MSPEFADNVAPPALTVDELLAEYLQDPSHPGPLEKWQRDLLIAVIQQVAGIPEDELDPADQRKRQDAQAYLVGALAPLVSKLASRYSGNGVDYDELCQTANLELLQCTAIYDSTQSDFLTFAEEKLDWALRRKLRDQGAVVRVPRRIYEAVGTITRYLIPEAIASGQPISAQNFAPELGMSETMTSQALAAIGRGHISDNFETVEREQPANDHSFEHAILRADIERGLTQLKPKERKAIELCHLQGLTQEQASQEMGISQMHVSRILRKARRNLGELLAEYE